MGGKSYAWAVTVSGDNEVPQALLSSESLSRRKTTGSILAVVDSSVSTESISLLNKWFDCVIMASGYDSNYPRLCADFLTLECWKISSFARIVVLKPGVMTIRQADDVFDTIGVIAGDGDFQGIVLHPNRNVYNKVSELFQKALLEGKPKRLVDAFRSSSFGNEVCTVVAKAFSLAEVATFPPKLSSGASFSFAIMDEHEINNNWNSCSGQISTENEIRKWIIDTLEKVDLTNTQPGHDMWTHKTETQNWIAIVGVSCRFPDANNLDEYWDLLVSGRNTCRTLHLPRNTNSAASMKCNFLKCRIDEFDASFFGMSPVEATFTDPQTRLLLETSWEAFEDAGINPGNLRGSQIGFFYGSWMQEYKDLLNQETPAVHEYLRKYLGNSFGSTAAKLSFFYGFTGPNLATESGCSSSMVAVDLACKSLLMRECPVALAAGANLIMQLGQHSQVWADDGKCKTFDASANGYARAEGVAVLVLKRYSDALRDGDRMYGIIRGCGVSQEGLTKSYGSPTVESESLAMSTALFNASLRPHEVDYIEAHATGTSVGDPIEAAAICKVYSGNRDRPLIIGSGKTNIGHAESCSGLAGMIKVLLALKHGIIPPHINLVNRNPKVNFDSIPGVIPLEAVPWKVSSRKRIAGVSSFGITGTDVHVLIQEPPVFTPKSSKHRTLSINILALSAKSEQALENLKKDYLDYLENTQEDILDICFTASSCRTHHPFRLAVAAESKENLRELLQSNLGMSGKVCSGLKVCFTFPGITGKMNFSPVKTLYDSFPVFQRYMDYCDSIVQKLCGASMKTAWNEDDFFGTSRDQYPVGFPEACIISAQYSLAKLWNAWGIPTHCVMGHCLGELVAGVVSGILEIQDGIEMVVKCKRLREQTLPGAMLAVSASKECAIALSSKFLENNQPRSNGMWLDVACANCKNQTTIAGSPEAIQEFKEYCQSQGIKTCVIPVDLAIHSRAIDPVIPDLIRITSQFKSSPQAIPYISSVTGGALLDSEIDGNHWAQCFRGEVNYIQACQTSYSMGFGVYLNVGFDTAFSLMTELNHSPLTLNKPHYLPSLHSTGNKHNLTTALKSLSKMYTIGVDINWKSFYWGIPTRKVSLPKYPFQRKSFWMEKKDPVNGHLTCINTFTVHPLLGANIPNASDKVIFQCDITPGKLDYIYDHCIKDQVIFPAAAHLELMLASGCLHFEDGPRTNFNKNIVRKPPCPIQIEEFIVHQPLHVGTSPKRIQTILERTDDGNVKIFVHSENPRNKNEWSMFASGGFSPISGDVREELTFDFSQLLSQPEGMDSVETFYGKLSECGLMFGPQFVSISTLYLSERETLAQIKFPVTELEQYVCHPIISDAMIQTFIFHTLKDGIKKLHVPIKIKRFISFPRNWQSNKIGKLYAYCNTQSAGLANKVYLVDEEGTPLGLMMYPELISTSPQALLDAAGCFSDAKKHPSIYEEYWKPVDALKGGYGAPSTIGGKNTWILIHTGEDANLLVDNMKDTGRDCVCVSIDALEDIFSQGKLEQFLGGLVEKWKSEIEGILFVVDQNPANGLDKTKKLLDPLVTIVKMLLKLKLKVLPQLHLITSGAWLLGGERKINEMSPLNATLWGFLRSMRAEIPVITSKSVDLDPDCDFVAQTEVLISEILKEDKENEVVYRSGTRYIRRLRKELPSSGKLLQYPQSQCFTVHLPASKILSDLEYVPRRRQELDGDEVEIEIRAASLNFKDVLNIMKPTKEFEEMKTIGLDYAGVITKVGSLVQRWKEGDAVFGCSFDKGTISSHLVSKEGLVSGVPQKISFAEAATLPAVFLTAWYCMVNIANLQPKQSILIHAASGGVGLMAIPIAKMLGVNIIGTAGSVRKRNFVRSFGVEHIFSSRNLEYGKKILELTGGAGVDMVLNCLTGPGFKETSLEVCREGGHFTEISKVDVWTEHEVKARKPSVNYNIVYMPDVASDVVQEIRQKLVDLVEAGFIKPLPFVRYHASNIVQALTFLQKAKQIGKVVVEMPYAKSGTERFSWQDKMFNDRSSYLITGGFGDIGLAVGNWMVDQGAKYLILVGRREPSEAVSKSIKDMEAKGVTVLATQVDISDYYQCSHLLNSISSSGLPPLRGVHHCAGVISDCLIGKQDWHEFERVLAPKVNGSWNLHKLTADYNLEFFVMYSSLTSTFGNVGQANYTAANAYMDSLATMRDAKGYKVLNINWGQWDAGMAKGLELYSAIPFPVQDGISALEKLMKDNKVRAMAADVNFRNLVMQCPFLKENLLEDMEIESATSLMNISSGNDVEEAGDSSFLDLYFGAEDDLERKTILKGMVIGVVSKVLGLKPEEIEVDTGFSDIGMDSLMSIEFMNNLQSELGDVTLGFIDIEESGTVKKICDLIEELMNWE